LQIGRWGELAVRPGFYLYVGSALGPGGLLARVSRHCRGVAKKQHWHIDYLHAHSKPVAVWYRYSRRRLEHDWATVLVQMVGTVPVEGFGCSDCNCDAHLFFTARALRPETFAEAVACPVNVLTCDSVARSGVLQKQV
jgi:Uri superfamily endonuclease